METFSKQMDTTGLRPDGLASPVSYRFDLIPAGALMKMAEVMAEGAATGHKDDGWREMKIADLINHALGHIVKYQMGQEDEDHLAHAMVRVMMAWEKVHMADVGNATQVKTDWGTQKDKIRWLQKYSGENRSWEAQLGKWGIDSNAGRN